VRHVAMAHQATYPRFFAAILRRGMSNPPLFGLAHDEVCHAVSVAGNAVGSYPTFSPLPLPAVCFLWHFLYGCGLGKMPEGTYPVRTRPGRYPASRSHEPGLSSTRISPRRGGAARF